MGPIGTVARAAALAAVMLSSAGLAGARGRLVAREPCGAFNDCGVPRAEYHEVSRYCGSDLTCHQVCDSGYFECLYNWCSNTGCTQPYLNQGPQYLPNGSPDPTYTGPIRASGTIPGPTTSPSPPPAPRTTTPTPSPTPPPSPSPSPTPPPSTAAPPPTSSPLGTTALSTASSLPTASKTATLPATAPASTTSTLSMTSESSTPSFGTRAANTTGDAGSGSSTGAIAGGVAGGAAALVALGAVAYALRKRSGSHTTKLHAEASSSVSAPLTRPPDAPAAGSPPSNPAELTFSHTLTAAAAAVVPPPSAEAVIANSQVSQSPHWFFLRVAGPQGLSREATAPYSGPPIVVAEKHNPTSVDEIALFEGTFVEIRHVFRDGWALGSNLDTGAYGMFPVDCLLLSAFIPSTTLSTQFTTDTARTRVESQAVAVTSAVLGARREKAILSGRLAAGQLMYTGPETVHFQGN